MGTTNFPNGVTSFGSLVTGGGIPSTFGNTQNKGAGKVFFVNPTTGSDGNSGLSMNKPFATIAKAYSLVTSDNHDVIVLSATSAHAQTDEITVAKNRVHFHGLDAVGRYLGQRTRVTMGVTTGTAIAIVQNTGVGNTFQNIKFDSSDTLATSLYTFADGGEYTYIGNCEIHKSTDLDQTTSGVLLCNGDSSLYQNCSMGSLQNGHAVSVNRPVVKFDRETITGKVARDVRMDNCQFLLNTSTTAASHLHGTGATDIERSLILKDCLFINAILGSADPAQAIKFDSALTQGYVAVVGGGEVGCTALSTTTGVFSLNATAAAGGGSGIQAT